LVLAVACGVLPVSPAAAQQMRPIFFEVKLPAGATLEIDGYLTKSTGDSRSFETPPVATGRSYAYAIKAVLGDRQVTKKIVLRPEERAVFDLRPDFAAAARATPEPKPLTEQELERPGFVAILEKDGVSPRLWVFRAGSKELEAYKKSGGLERHVSRIKAGPRGLTVKAPDGETLDEYLKALEK